MKQQHFNTRTFLISTLVLVAVMTTGLLSVFSLARHERQRDLNNWQITLSIMADSRASEILKWSDDRFAVLRELAANGSLQLYVQQVLFHPEEKRETEAVQLSYLRNLITTTGQRSGFFDSPKTSMPVPANVAFHADNGLAILAAGGKIITSTPGFSSPDTLLKKHVDEVLANGKHLFVKLHLNENQQPVAGFLLPVFALQKQSDQQGPIAVLYGFTNAAASLFRILETKTLATQSAETLLVRGDENLVTYISPLADNTAPLTRTQAANTHELLAAFALRHPGQFGQGIDYSGAKNLFTSRRLHGLQMTLIQKITVDEALAESQNHQRFLLTSLLMALLLGSSLLVAAWWYGSSVKERKAALALLDKSRRLEAQTNLLNAINDNMTDFILLLDLQFRVIFANKTLADRLDLPAVDFQGKSLSSLFGPDAAKQFEPLLQQTTTDHKLASRELSFDMRGEFHLFYATSQQVAYDYKGQDSILLTLNDVTQLQEAQTKKDRLMKQIVSSLMRAIDLHDPHSANHSAKTARIALAIGRAMGLGPDKLSSLDIAASLCNLGKLSIPKEILLKEGGLTEKERDIVKNETTYASEILEGIDFEGPVVETIVQKHEFLDGNGYPMGISGEKIILPARILAAANAFVAMTSPRAYRERLTNNTAMDLLFQDCDTKYDRQVIAALFHVVENEESILDEEQ